MQTQSRSEMQAEALDRARTGQSVANYAAIYSGFMAKGIAESDIKPRENVFTFNAWKALGRSVKKGEHGVKITTFVNVDGRESDDGTESESYRMPKTVTVFHILQTAETTEQQKQWDANRKAKYSGYQSRRRDYSRRPSDGAVEHGLRDPGEDSADRWTESNR